MINIAITAARLELYDRAAPTPEFLAYVRNHGINVMHVGNYIGACGVLPIDVLPGSRFEFTAEFRSEGGVTGEIPSEHTYTIAFVCEGIGEDGVTVLDLVAWPVDRPEHVFTMFGRVGMMGAWEASAGGWAIMGGLLPIHRTPLDWLKAGCEGAAIVTPHIAARQLLDLPGRIAARDLAHGHYLTSLIRRVIPDDMVLVPAQRRAA